MNNKKHTDTDKKIKFWVFYEQECMAHGLTSGSNITAYEAYKIFGLYKYNPKLSHWKNFCNRWKWPFPHKKLENVTLDWGNKMDIVLMLLTSWIYVFRGGPKYPAFWFYIFCIAIVVSPVWIIPLVYPGI